MALTNISRRITYANVISTTALFLALGGVSYATYQLPANSVGNEQLKANAVTTDKVKDGTLKTADIAPGELGKLVGPKGPKGDAGIAGVETRVLKLGVDAGGTGSGVVACPQGKVALGGGATIAGGLAG